MRSELSDEVLFAACSLTIQPHSVISRRMIEDEIQKRPYLYPYLSSATSLSRRRVIGSVMNCHFSAWGSSLKNPCLITAWTIRFEYPAVFREIEHVSC